jgi:MFS family permease
MAMVGDLLPSGRRAGALGLVGAVDTLGWVLGPIWGALLVEIAPGQDPWRWVFIVNVPLAGAAAVAIGRVGEAKLAIGKGWMSRLDLPGVLLLAGTLLTLNLGLSAGGELGAPAGGARALGGSRNPVAELVIPLLGVAAVLAVLLVQRQRRAVWPLLPVSLFRDRQFTAAIVANFLVGASLIVAMVDIPVITAMLVDQPSVSRVSALMLAPFTVLIALLSFAGGRIVSRVGFRRTASIGLVLVAVGYAALWLGLRNGVLIGMVPGLVLAGAGFGLVFAPIGATAIDAAPDPDRGIAAAMILVFRLLGMTIGISTLTAIAVRRLQGLVGNLEDVVQTPGESTADFLARQTSLLYETVLPVSLQVARETFLLAGAIALLGLIPVALFASRGPAQEAH